ncbi:Sec-independent protein translocase protein TatB [Phenylobacterium sp.]|uniref:Sec-independent protein translocase protein TatB n=1 Tax=Phenylobacterium sp. TaxID=1871053 RepID=UPI002C777562|nr:Sec-independent protein translocase protein TatB [Phenylobacterium sp.]HLZ77285.1 Sec-independent protein translocase protein TatB [Phenylobacterium sp.]
MFPEGRLFEFLIAATVALIVVGPKDLPILLRKFGQFMAKVRAMAAEFRASFDEMARQSELDELRKEVEAMRKGQLDDIATHAPEMNQAFDEISQGLSDVGVSFNSPVYTPAQTAHIEEAPARTPRVRKTAAKKAPAQKAPAKAAAAKKAAAPKAVAKAAAPKAPAKPEAAALKPAAKPKAPAAKAAPAKPRARKAAVS